MKLFNTNKTESLKSRFTRLSFNLWPCLFCTGGTVRFISSDYKEMHVSLGLSPLTYNKVGTIFGGSIYSSIDPHFMLMFMHILSKDYIVWDKGVTIKFIRPATSRIKCRFLLTDTFIDEVKQEVASKGEHTFDLPLQYVDELDNVYAVFTKTMYVAARDFYKQKLAAKQNKA